MRRQTIKRGLLHDRLLLEDQPSVFREAYQIPTYIQDNLHNELREYQKAALRHFHYTQISDQADYMFDHLLFNMATGSGKTMVMAGLILYLYKEQGKQNFIFFVNSDAIIRKTFENLINSHSSKYLFNPKGIIIEGELITIETVSVFPKNPLINTIYIKLTTIQKLHNDLTDYSENSLTYEELMDKEIVLLGDEAHHFNVDTKRKLSITEIKQLSWENTVSNILKLGRKNRLLEFTATIDLSNSNLEDKYKDKIVYHYDLTQFMQDGFSKNVKRIHADSDDETKMMDAILLSQYRKKIAFDNEINDFKPVIMFKANRVNTSLKKHRDFNILIENLSSTNISKFMKGRLQFLSEHSALFIAYKYHLNSSLTDLVNSLKSDFATLNVLNVNGTEMLDMDNANLLNSLEDRNNPIRVVFAVAKLSEGWDVLNLYDIVRISENSSNSISSTDSEVQLIGRGARYYPFEYAGTSEYNRRFDDSISDLRILEELHYHTINEKKYIDNLNKSIELAKLLTEDDQDQVIVFSAKIKKKFFRSQVYRNGLFFSNEVREVSSYEYNDLSAYGIENIWETQINLTSSETNLDGLHNYQQTLVQQELIKDGRYFKKAMSRNPFFAYSTLKSYLPRLRSKNEFITSVDYLGGITVKVMINHTSDLNKIEPYQKLRIYEELLSHLAVKIRNNYLKQKGTRVFKGIPISSFVKDYDVIINPNQFVSQYGERISQWTIPHDWFVYDKFIGNNLEHSFIELFSGFISQLEKKYNQVYLIRNDEKKTRFKVTEFDGVRGFMPDFIIYLSDEEFVYQVFIEPKGEHLVLHDKWKEDFMESINSDIIEIIGENEQTRLIGVRFFTGKSDKLFHQEFTDKLL